jgi:hypothetical protein
MKSRRIGIGLIIIIVMLIKGYFLWLFFSVGDPDPHVFGPPESVTQRYGSGSGSFPFLIKVLSGLT